MYFRSGLEPFESLAQQAQPPEENAKLDKVNALFDRIKVDNPDLIDAINQFPIECQIVTATQHIYNRAQRPHYEFILQARNNQHTMTSEEIRDLAERFELLKLNLLAIDHNVYSIHRKFGISYDISYRINPRNLFGLKGRLPKYILGKNARIEKINTHLLPTLISSESTSLKRQNALSDLFQEIEQIDNKVLHRANTHRDIVSRKLLDVTYLQQLSHPEIIFWAFQRLVLLIIGVIIVYTPDKGISRALMSALKFRSDIGSDVDTLADFEIVIGRLFEQLEHIDNAIYRKLILGESKIAQWKDGYFNGTIFSDPIIQWRYASFMYGKREYANALQETNVGIAVYKQLDDWKSRGVSTEFSVPELAKFMRRRVEYELCAEVSRLKSGTASVAAILELCIGIAAHQERWNEVLTEIMQQSRDFTEQARCQCLKILFTLCSISTGGLKGQGLEVVRQQHRTQFEELEKTILRKGPNSIRDRTWWLLAASIMSEGQAQKSLEQFSKRIQGIAHHPVERKQFEETCAKLIALWMPDGVTGGTRSEFDNNILVMLKEQTERLTNSEALSFMTIQQLKEVTELVAEVQRELAAKGKIETHGTLRKKLTAFATDAIEHVVVDTAVTGLKAILGI